MTDVTGAGDPAAASCAHATIRPPMTQDIQPRAGAATPASSDAGNLMDPERLGQRTWWTTVGIVYAVGAYLVAAIAITERNLPVAIVAAAGSLGAAIASARLLERDLLGPTDHASAARDGVPVRLVLVAVVGAVAAVSAAQWADTVMGALAPGVAIAAIVASVPARRQATAIGTGAAATVGVVAGAQQVAVGHVDWSHVANQALITGVVAGGLTAARWFWALVHRLEAARQLEARLAVADERLRFAADLHDIQGHHLQVIALKSELATRLAEVDPAASSAQMAEVQEHARTALTDTRAVVQGYRQTPLADELANATRVLEAAGIAGRLDHGVVDRARTVDGPGRLLLGLVVREATTNILRHSDAHRARLTLAIEGDRARLAIHNDGAATPDHPPGTGLAGLQRRLEAAGGTLQWKHRDGWFTLTAQVPVAEQPA